MFQKSKNSDFTNKLKCSNLILMHQGTVGQDVFPLKRKGDRMKDKMFYQVIIIFLLVIILVFK